jgi:DNA-binding transcriptional LysR family regulator
MPYAWACTRIRGLRLRHIEVFSAITLTGSTNGAAKILHVSQPAISKMLQHAERSVGFRLFLRSKVSTRQSARIVACELDGGFLTWRYLPQDKSDIDGLREIRLFDCRLKLAVQRGSRPAKSLPKKLAPLQGEPCIWFPREIAPAYDDFLTYQCQKAGLSPKKVQIGSDVLTILGLVAAGMGYSIVSDVSAYTCPRDVVLVDHPELTMSHPVSFVYRADDSNPALLRFVDLLQNVAALSR